jgi:hypothetical protein
MTHAIGRDGILERLNDMVLTDDLGPAFGTVFSV